MHLTILCDILKVKIYLDFRFFGYGCCNFDNIIREAVTDRKGDNVLLSIPGCKKRCLEDQECIAIDIEKDLLSETPDVNENKFICYLSKGTGRNFKLGCDPISDPDNDIYDRRCFKLHRPGK